jgi:hypothetical protein
MLPDYPSIKRKIKKKFVEAVEKEIQKDPLLSTIKSHHVREGDRLTSSSIDGYSESVEYKTMTAKFEITKEEIINKGPDAIFSKVDELAKEMVKQKSQLIFNKMEEVTERTGQVVDAKSKPLSPQLILEGLEKVAIDFDEYGKPIFPSLVLSHDQYEKIKDKIPKWEADPEFQKKHKELIEKKRQEWIDRENCRKLVD